MQHERQKGNFGTGVVVVIAVVLVVVVAYFALQPYGLDVKNIIPQATNTHTDNTNSREIDWSSYPENIVAWVRVPDTNIDYPIALASSDDPTFYLSHDPWGSYDVYGTPYISYLCAQGLQSPNVIIYGHHMSDGTVFADFARMSSQDYATNHSTINLYQRSDNSLHELKVIGANVIDADDEGVVTEFVSSAELNAYLKSKLAESEVVLSEPASINRLYTFVTCSYESSNARTLIYAIENQ